MPQTGGARGGKPQSRLSSATKSAIKSSGLSGQKKKALRQELRSPGVSAREKKLTGMASGRNSATMSTFTKQATRSKSRAAAQKNGNSGGYRTKPGQR